MNIIAARFSSSSSLYILQMFTSLDEEIHVIVANLQMKTYVFNRREREKSRHSPTLKEKEEVGNQFMLEHTNVTLIFFCILYSCIIHR